MPSIRCPHCTGAVHVGDDADGVVTCPYCGKAVRPDGRGSGRSDPPSPPARRRPTDGGDDRPARRRPRRTDDEDEIVGPRRKTGSGVGLVLGIVGGVLLIGCLGCGGIGYYFFQKAKAVKNKIDEAVAAAEEHNDKVTQANAESLREGMTRREVEDVLGPGRQLDEAAFSRMTTDNSDLTQQFINDEHRRYWSAWVAKGLVYRWQDGPSYILVAYNDPPDRGGKLKGLSYSLPSTFRGDRAQVHNERIKLPRNPAADDDAVRLGIAQRDGPAKAPGDPTTARPGPKTPKSFGDTKDMAIRLPAVDLAADPKKYQSKWCAVTGTVARIDADATSGSGTYELAGPAPDKIVHCIFKPDAFGPALTAAPGDVYTVTGMVSLVGDECQLLDCTGGFAQAITPRFTATQLAGAYARSQADGDRVYKGKVIKLSGKLAGLKIGADDNGVTLHGNESPKAKRPPVRIAAHFAGTGWKARVKAYQVGDTAVVAGTVDYFADGVVHLKDCCLLTK